MTRPYEILPLVERTPAWWEWRRNGIGSADAATILGAKPAKSVERLLREKQQPDDPPARNFARDRDAKLERAARAACGLASGETFHPACVQRRDRPWQRASLDGLSGDGRRAVEIKCGRAAYQSACARARPPRHHYAQLQHILSVTDLPTISYWCHLPPHRPLHLEIARDDRYIERLLAAETAFWNRLTSPTANQHEA